MKARVPVNGRDGSESGRPVPVGDPLLSLHIPDFSGPLTPAACDRSLARAQDFFARHFPEERHEIAVCHSWLLDPQLTRYLPADSNIVRFQRRFTLVPSVFQPSNDAFNFVFDRVPASMDELTPRTTLERALVDHVRSGGRWGIRTGWLEV